MAFYEGSNSAHNARGPNVSVLHLKSGSEPWETKSSVYSSGGGWMVETPAQQQVSRELSPVRWCDKEVDGVYLGRSGWVQVQHKSAEETLRPPLVGAPVKIKMADYHCSRSEPGHLHGRQRRPGYLPLPSRGGLGNSLDLSPRSPVDYTRGDPAFTPPPITPIISPPPAFQDNNRRYLEVLSSPMRTPRATPPYLARADAIEVRSPPASPPSYRRLLSPMGARPNKRTPSPLSSPRSARSLEEDTGRRSVLYRQKYDSSSSSSGSFGFRSLDAGGSGSRGGGAGLPRLAETDSSLGGYEDGDEEDNNNNEDGQATDTTLRNCSPPPLRHHPRPPPPRRSPNSHHHHHHHQHNNNCDTELSPARSPCSTSSSSSSCSGHRSPSAAQLRLHHRRHHQHHHHQHQLQPTWNINGNSSRVRRSRSLQLPERRSPGTDFHNPPPTNHTGTVERHRKRFPFHSRSVQSEESTLEAEMRREAEEEARVVTEFLYGLPRFREAGRGALSGTTVTLRSRGLADHQLNPCNPTTCDFWPHCAHRDGLYTTTRVTTPSSQPLPLRNSPCQPIRASHSCPDRAAHPRATPRAPSSRSSPASLERMNDRQREVSPTLRPRLNSRRLYYNGSSLDAEDSRRKNRTRRNPPPPLEDLATPRNGNSSGAVESPPPPLLLSPSPLNTHRHRGITASTSEEEEAATSPRGYQRQPERPGSAPAAAEPRRRHSPHSPPDQHHHQRSLSLPKCFQPPPPPSTSRWRNLGGTIVVPVVAETGGVLARGRRQGDGGRQAHYPPRQTGVRPAPSVPYSVYRSQHILLDGVLGSTNWQGQQSAAVGAALPPRQPYMSATLDGYQYRRHRKQQQYFPQQQQQQQQKLHWHSTTSPTTAQYPTGLLAPVKIPGRHTQSLSRTAPPTPVQEVGAAGGLCCPTAAQNTGESFNYGFTEDCDEDNGDRYSSAPLLLDPHIEYNDDRRGDIGHPQPPAISTHEQGHLLTNDEWPQQPSLSTASREWSQEGDNDNENYEDYGMCEKTMDEATLAAARIDESSSHAVRARSDKHASLPPGSRNTLPGHSNETSVLQKFKKSFSLRFYKKGGASVGGGSGVASQDEEDNPAVPSQHSHLRGSDLEATSQESIDQDPVQLHPQQHYGKKSNVPDEKKDETAPASNGSNNEKFRFGPLVWRSSKERKKAKKATRSAKCNSGDSGIQVEVVEGETSGGNRLGGSREGGCDSSESHDTDDIAGAPSPSQSCQLQTLHPSTAGTSINDGNDTPLEDEPDSPAVVRRRSTARGQQGTSHYYQRPSRPTSDVINQILIDKLKADLQASRGTSKNGGQPVRRTHSDLGGQRLYNWDSSRGCYGRRGGGMLTPGSPGKTRAVPPAPVSSGTPAPLSPRPPHRMTEAQIRHLKRLRWRPTHLRRSISQPIGINELSPLMQRKPAGRNIVRVLSEDERGAGRGGVATSSDDEIALSDSGSSLNSLTGRKKSFELAMNEQVVILAEAVWDHVAMEMEELAFRAGDVIEVLDTLDKDWWWGATGQQTGWFPSAFVRLRVSQEETVEDCLEECMCGRRTDDRTSVGSSVRRRGTNGAMGGLLSSDQIRTRVVTELVNTERDFVKILKDVQQGFLTECRKRTDMFNEDQIRSIFSNLEELLEFQVLFLNDLETTIDWEVPHQTCLADTFLKHHSGFRMYSEYCNSHPMAIATLQELYQKNSYRKFFEACRLMRGLIEIPLDGYLLTPVQRICKYPLQLAELLKYTKTDHPDYYKLSEALNAMRGVAVLINERKRRMESLEKLAAWQQRVEGWEGEDLIESSSQLIHQSEAVRITTGLWTTNITLFLFDHQLVYCKKDILKKNTYVYKGRIRTDTSQIVSLNDGKDATLGVTIRHGIKVHCSETDKWLLFCMRSWQEKQQWLEAFRRERDLVERDARDGLELGPSARQLVQLASSLGSMGGARPGGGGAGGGSKQRAQLSGRYRQRRRRPQRPNQETQNSKKRERVWRLEECGTGSGLTTPRRGTPPPSGSPQHLQPQPPQPPHNTSLGKKVGTWFTFGANRKTRRAAMLNARASTVDSTIVHPS